MIRLVKCPKCDHEFEPEEAVEAPAEETPAEVEEKPEAAEETV